MLNDTEFIVAPDDHAAWADGQRAAECGESLEHCPYPDGSGRDAWLVAWLLTQTRHDCPSRPAARLD